MLIYFHIDELARDSIVAAGLRKEAKRLGHTLIYGNRLMTHHMLKWFNYFDAIILPSIVHFQDVFRDQNNVPKNVFILQTEAIGQATGRIRRIHGKYFGDQPDKCVPWHSAVAGYLLWGHTHKQPFEDEYRHYLDKVKVVGHPRLADKCKRPTYKSRAGKKPVVGFISRFGLFSPWDGRSTLMSVYGGMRYGKASFPLYENSGDMDVEDTYFTAAVDCRLFLQLMMMIDKDKFDIKVRPHPRESRKSWEEVSEKLNLGIEVSKWDEPFVHWIHTTDYLISPPSTSFYDLFYHQKSPILIDELVKRRRNHILVESDDNNQILEGCYRPGTPEEVIQMIESGNPVPLKKEIIDKHLYEQVGADIAANSIENMILFMSEKTKLTDRSFERFKKTFMCHLFCVLGVALSHIRWLKGLLSRRVVQGANFDLTISRIRWINQLNEAES